MGNVEKIMNIIKYLLNFMKFKYLQEK